MRPSFLLIPLLLIAVVTGRVCAEQAEWNSEIRKLAHGYLAKRSNCALVIGVAKGRESQVAGFGRLDNGKVPDANTIFEIGSITKVFTALTLQVLAEKGLLNFDDRADKYLPNGLTLPEREGRAITLLDLATHTSGLSRLPGNLKIQENPYARYGREQLYECLRSTKLQRKPGQEYDYSNLGFGVLGQVLEMRAGKRFEEAVREALLVPIGMTNTMVTLSAAERLRLARGHDYKGRPTSNWDFDALAGAGAFRSTAAEMLKFLAANMAPDRTPFAAAVRTAQKTHFSGKVARVGLGWHKLNKTGMNVIWHNGGTGGYVSFIGFAPKEQVGVVLLSNYGDALANDSSADKLALDILAVLRGPRAE